MCIRIIYSKIGNARIAWHIVLCPPCLCFWMLDGCRSYARIHFQIDSAIFPVFFFSLCIVFVVVFIVIVIDIVPLRLSVLFKFFYLELLLHAEVVHSFMRLESITVIYCHRFRRMRKRNSILLAAHNKWGRPSDTHCSVHTIELRDFKFFGKGSTISTDTHTHMARHDWHTRHVDGCQCEYGTFEI